MSWLQPPSCSSSTRRKNLCPAIHLFTNYCEYPENGMLYWPSQKQPWIGVFPEFGKKSTWPRRELNPNTSPPVYIVINTVQSNFHSPISLSKIVKEFYVWMISTKWASVSSIRFSLATSLKTLHARKGRVSANEIINSHFDSFWIRFLHYIPHLS